MNSLSYISRQLDVLVSNPPPRAPPSTPTTEHKGRLLQHNVIGSSTTNDSDVDVDELTIKRVKTWSKPLARALDTAVPSLLQVPDRKRANLRRSVSTPSSVIFPISLGGRRVASGPSSATSTSEAANAMPRAVTTSMFRRIFIVRILVLAWQHLCDTWAAWTGNTPSSGSAIPIPAKDAPTVEAGQTSSTDSDSDSADEKRPLLYLSLSPPSIRLSHFPPPDLELDDSNIPLKPSIDRTVSTPTPVNAAAPTPGLATPVSVPLTPPARIRKGPILQPKTLVLDLDETLIHSTTRPMRHLTRASWSNALLSAIGLKSKNKSAGHVVEVILNGRRTLYHVYKRPFVDYFLRKVSGWYTLVVFTASMKEYADPVIDWLDAGTGILNRRFFRESCTQINGQYAKDLSIVEADLSRVCLLDNSPVCYRLNEANGIPIEGWTSDPLDEALLDLLPVLDSLRFTSDVRRVLGIRGFA